MKSLDQKLIIYDSNCKVCSSLRDVVLKFTSIPENKIIAYKDLNADLYNQIDINEFRNGMALIDRNNQETIYGANGVAYIFSSQYRIVDLLLRFQPFLKVFSFLYSIQAYNRYVMATPKSNFNCDCHPDRVAKYRISYIVMTVLLSVLLTMLFGISLKNFFTDISATEAAIQMLLMAGSGWAVQIMLAMIVMKDKSLDYIGHLGSIMVVGLLILVPWMIFFATTGILNIYIPALSVVISSGYMLYLHIHRIKHLELPQVWTISWFLFLQITAFYWVYVFHFN